jgi:hypothetical protein
MGFNNDLVPVLRPVFLQVLVGSGDEVVAALELRPAHVDATVGIHRGTKFQLQDEVLREFLLRENLLDFAGRARMHHQRVDAHAIAGIGALILPVEFFRDGAIGLIVGPKAPAGEILVIEERNKARLGLEVVGGTGRNEQEARNQGQAKQFHGVPGDLAISGPSSSLHRYRRLKHRTSLLGSHARPPP